ncbi:MAG: AtpZ/AtpI family protein [Pseudomonadota bacterium]
MAEKPDPFAGFDRRLDAAEAERRKAKPDDDDAGRPSPYGGGFQAGIDVFAGVAVGVAMGWFLDGWLGTRPLFLVLFLILGFGAGLRNAYRTMLRLAPDDDRG